MINPTVAPAVPRSLGGKPGRHLVREGRLLHVAFVTPALIAFVGLALLPTVVGFWYSFTDWRVGSKEIEFIGLANYEELLEDRLFWNSLRATLLFVALNVPLKLALSIVLALILNRTRWLTQLTRTTILVPMAMSPIAIGILFALLTSPSVGVLPEGITMQNPTVAIATVVLADVWASVGISTFLILAGLQTINSEMLEAAAVDGAGSVRRTRAIILPLLRPTLVLTTVLIIAHAFRTFGLILALTEGGPYRATEVLTMRMYKEAFGASNLGYGAAISVVLFVIIAVISLIPIVLGRRRR